MIFLRPSGSSFWTKCAAYPQFVQNTGPKPGTDAAREGTCAAWVAEVVINDGVPLDDMLGRFHENGVEVDADMIRHLADYIDALTKIGGGTMSAEVHSKFIPGLLEGTADAASYHEFVFDPVLRVVDLKYGYSTVDEFENTQLGIYAGGFLADHHTHVEMTIFQPRAPHPSGPCRTWSVTRAEFLRFTDHLREQAMRTQQVSVIATPGKHCVNCDAAHACRALAMSVYSLWDVIEDTRLHHLTPAELAQELDMIDRMESVLTARATAARAQAETLIKNGGMVPGWTMLSRAGKKYLKEDPDLIEALTGVSPWEKKLKTPAQMIRDGVPKTVVDIMSSTPEIGRKLSRLPKNYLDKMFGNNPPLS